MRSAILLVVLLVAGPAHATILVHDSRFGPGTLIEDTTAGLEILKVTATTNIGIDAMTAALEPGGAYEEFRYGTTSEYGAFLTGLGPTIEDATWRRLVELLGPTLVTPAGTQFLFTQFGPGDRPNDSIVLLSVIVFVDGSIGGDGATTTFGLANRPSPSIGYFLVADPLAVPLPPTALLLVVGVVGLVVRSRARR